VAPKSGVDYMGRGNCCFQTGRYKEALAEYDQSLKVQPKQTAVLRNKGLTLLQLGRKAEACAQFQEALALGDAEASRYLQASCR
jgi:Flp pilus assembly protein TadD